MITEGYSITKQVADNEDKYTGKQYDKNSRRKYEPYMEA